MEYFVWNISPILFEIGSIQIQWYGFFFTLAFIFGYLFLLWMCKRENSCKGFDTILLYLIFGTVAGARLMHCLAYEPEFYLANPLEIIKIWEHGGLASHGGMIGVILATYIFAKIHKHSFLWLLSRMAIAGTIVAIFVRFGNFFNHEILGLPSTLPWAIIFERIDSIPRHPVQLYESFSWVILLPILLLIYLKVERSFAIKLLPGVFFTFMFSVRFLLEFTKVSEGDLATVLPITTGQLLSIPFIVLGIVWIIWAFKTRGISIK